MFKRRILSPTRLRVLTADSSVKRNVRIKIAEVVARHAITRARVPFRTIRWPTVNRI
jgi:hypothetical protein